MRNILILVFILFLDCYIVAQETTTFEQEDTVYLYLGNSTEMINSIYSNGVSPDLSYNFSKYSNKKIIVTAIIFDEKIHKFENVTSLYIDDYHTEKNNLNLSKFINLKTLTINRCYSTISENDFSVLSQITTLNFFDGSSMIKDELNKNNIFTQLIENIERLTSLNQLNTCGCMSLILFNTPKLFNLKKLKCIYYDSFYYNDFFPIALLLNKDQYSEGVFVSFNHKIVRKPSPWCEIPSLFSLLNWSKFEVIKDINTAYNRHEVMDSYNKNNFENISKSKINFPVNGPYIVANIFNNDTVNISCRGQFKNGQPDGKWLFYFCNGEISEERYYNEGIPVGVWGYKSSMSYIENVESNKYTSILRFKDGKLISIE